MPVEINYLAIFVAAIVSMAIGFGWYAQNVFGRQWISLMGFTKDQQDQMKNEGMTKMIVLGFAAEFIIALVLTIILSWANAITIATAMRVAFWVWLGFIATTSLATIIYERKPASLYLINIGYRFVSFIVMSAIIVSWS